MIVLGIESSCDETAAALVADDRTILADIVLSQLDDHLPYGGIVPEIAARAHLEAADVVVRRALDDAGVALDDIDGVAATGGPGLIGGVIVGVMTAKAVAMTRGLPFVAVNHMEGHALTARLTDGIAFPYLALLVSGGHCMLVVIEGIGRYHRLGATIDDAVGEAFDKTAKMLGLGFPGGPAVERMARRGNDARFALPRPLKGRDGFDFSFSGLKTAVRHTIEKLPEGALTEDDIADVCASFQLAVGDVLADRCGRAIEFFKRDWPDGSALVIAGGVSANQHLRAVLEPLARDAGLGFVAPPQALCTDNGAMIAWAGLERLRLGLTDGLDFAPRPRWPMDEAR